jgi:hypothetical protein
MPSMQQNVCQDVGPVYHNSLMSGTSCRDICSRHTDQRQHRSDALGRRPGACPVWDQLTISSRCLLKRTACRGRPPAPCESCFEANEECRYDEESRSSASPSRSGEAVVVFDALQGQPAPSDEPMGSMQDTGTFPSCHSSSQIHARHCWSQPSRLTLDCLRFLPLSTTSGCGCSVSIQSWYLTLDGRCQNQIKISIGY